MEKITVLCIIVLMVLSAGCTSYFSNLTATTHNLKLNEYTVFEKEGNRFSAQIQKVEGISSSSRISQVTVTIFVKNTGTKAVSLMAYPRLNDGNKKEYPGKSIFLGMVHPGGTASGKSTITIPSDEAYSALLKSATLSLRFQDTKLIPYEATWDIDLSTL